MTLFSYVVHHDTGMAPNPNDGFCTLVYCKFMKHKSKRRNIVELAKEGDWIIGTGGKNKKISSGHNTIIYIMRVDEKLPFVEYIRDSRFRGRSQGKKHGEFALISHAFLYYGRKAIPIKQIPGMKPADLEKKGPGFRNRFPPDRVRQLVRWIEKQHRKGKISEPCAPDPDNIHAKSRP
ncbi:MAG: hypothetical protein K8R46_01455 [Pirellulales bacterium]|nr:hypothetical protein [Pirellulales bacterium]